MNEIDVDEAEIARIIIRLPEFAWLETTDLSKIRHEIRHKIAKILQEYYRENTCMEPGNCNAKFKQAGINEDDGKLMISCARRLGIEIS